MARSIPYGHADTGGALVFDGEPTVDEIYEFIEPVRKKRHVELDHRAVIQSKARRVKARKG